MHLSSSFSMSNRILFIFALICALQCLAQILQFDGNSGSQFLQSQGGPLQHSPTILPRLSGAPITSQAFSIPFANAAVEDADDSQKVTNNPKILDPATQTCAEEPLTLESKLTPPDQIKLKELRELSKKAKSLTLECKSIVKKAKELQYKEAQEIHYEERWTDEDIKLLRKSLSDLAKKQKELIEVQRKRIELREELSEGNTWMADLYANTTPDKVGERIENAGASFVQKTVFGYSKEEAEGLLTKLQSKVDAKIKTSSIKTKEKLDKIRSTHEEYKKLQRIQTVLENKKALLEALRSEANSPLESGSAFFDDAGTTYIGQVSSDESHSWGDSLAWDDFEKDIFDKITELNQTADEETIMKYGFSLNGAIHRFSNELEKLKADGEVRKFVKELVPTVMEKPERLSELLREGKLTSEEISIGEKMQQYLTVKFGFYFFPGGFDSTLSN